MASNVVDAMGGDDLSRVEELLLRLTNLRRSPQYRRVLAEGTGFVGQLTPMRILRAIDALSHQGSPPSIREVAERLEMEQSNTSRAIDQAVTRGFVDKRPSDNDARRTELWLAPQGKQAINELDIRRAAVHEQMLTDWTQTEIKELTRLLEKLCRSYQEL